MDEFPGESKQEKTAESNETADSPQITPTGMKAVRGIISSRESTRPDPAKIHQVAPGNEYVAEATTLNPAAANDLEISAQRAMASKATHYHNESRDSKIAEYRRLRSEITEDIACQNVKDGVRADAYSVSGANFPTYDILGSSEVSSVKALTLKNGVPRYGAYRMYFEEIANPSSEANQKAALELKKIKESDPEKWQDLSSHLPPQVEQATSVIQASRGLAETSSLRIPEDQVQFVRQDLRNYVLAHPGKFGFPEDARPVEIGAQVREMVDRKVLSIDGRFETAHYQGKAVELSRLRDLNLSRR